MMAEETLWVSVREDLPEVKSIKFLGIIVNCSDAVLCQEENGTYVVCHLYDDGNFCDDYGEKREVVKWMPIPEH